MLKKRIMIFKGDIQKHGIKYALACQVIFHGEQSSLAIIKKMAGRCYDYAYSLDYIQDERNQELPMESEENPVTPCGCIHCSCEECGVVAMCANI